MAGWTEPPSASALTVNAGSLISELRCGSIRRIEHVHRVFERKTADSVDFGFDIRRADVASQRLPQLQSTTSAVGCRFNRLRAPIYALSLGDSGGGLYWAGLNINECRAHVTRIATTNAKRDSEIA